MSCTSTAVQYPGPPLIHGSCTASMSTSKLLATATLIVGDGDDDVDDSHATFPNSHATGKQVQKTHLCEARWEVDPHESWCGSS